MKLNKELDGDAQRRADQHETDFASGQAHPVQQQHRHHAHAGKEEAVEHHVLHAHLVQGQAAKIEARAPQASGQRTSPVTKKREPSTAD